MYFYVTTVRFFGNLFFRVHHSFAIDYTNSEIWKYLFNLPLNVTIIA